MMIFAAPLMLPGAQTFTMISPATAIDLPATMLICAYMLPLRYAMPLSAFVLPYDVIPCRRRYAL